MPQVWEPLFFRPALLTQIRASPTTCALHTFLVLHGASMATTSSHARLSISGLGWGFSAALVTLFVLCVLAALFVPVRLAHGWINLLSDAPIDSSRVWVEGLIWSVVIGWLIALVFGTIYNLIVGRRTMQEMAVG